MDEPGSADLLCHVQKLLALSLTTCVIAFPRYLCCKVLPSYTLTTAAPVQTVQPRPRYQSVSTSSSSVTAATIRLAEYHTPANYWAGQLSFGWSNKGHANSVAAVQFRGVACGCGPNAFARFVLFRNDVAQIKLNAFLLRSSVKSSLDVLCLVGPYSITTCAQEHHAGSTSAFARNDATAVSRAHAQCMSRCLPRPGTQPAIPQHLPTYFQRYVLSTLYVVQHCTEVMWVHLSFGIPVGPQVNTNQVIMTNTT